MPKNEAAVMREARQAAELRANLGKRKAQKRQQSVTAGAQPGTRLAGPRPETAPGTATKSDIDECDG